MYTDGGCHNTGNRKGNGSYAFLFKTDNKEYVDVHCEYIDNTTNNRMEMAAVIEGIKYAIGNIPYEIGQSPKYPKLTIVSDSIYLVKGYTDPAYLDRWITNGWKTSTNKPVQNRDMWLELRRLSWHMGFNFIHIRGHKKDGNKDHAFWNDICDRACTYMLNIQQPGFVFILRYYFKTKKFEIINTQLIERSKSVDCNGCLGASEINVRDMRRKDNVKE